MEIGLAYFTTARPIRQLEDSLRRTAQETSTFVCRLIARYVLFQEKTPTQRRKRLSTIGFDSQEHLPAFGIDQWVSSILAITIITFIVIVVMPRRTSIDGGAAFLGATLFAIQIGLSIVAGTFVARRFLQRDEGTGTRFPPIYELTLAGLIVVTLSAGLRIAAPVVLTLFRTSFDQSIDEFVHERWPGVLFPFVNTLSIGLMCSYLATLEWNRIRLAISGGICNGLAFAATAALVGFLLPSAALSRFNEDLGKAKFEIMLYSTMTGIVVGAMVIAMFKKSARRAQVAASPQISPRADEWEANPAKGSWAEIALGGYSHTHVRELEGRYVCFRPTFVNPEIINAYLLTIRWDMKQSCLTFQEDARADSAYIQRGQISIPEGKPYINFVTMDKGDVRLITVSRPDSQGLARGLILTLSNPRGMHFTPASTPVVIKRIGEQVPHLGFVHPEAPDYDFYKAHLLNVVPNYGVIGRPPVTD